MVNGGSYSSCIKYLSIPKLHTSEYNEFWQVSQYMGDRFIGFAERFIVKYDLPYILD
jgi:hypothetical protein